MRNLYPVILFTLLSLCAGAQNSLSGRIRDKESREPVYAASIYIADLKQGTQSDTSGFFIFRKIPEGSFSLEVHLLGYAPQVLKINTKDKQELEILLSKSAGELHEVAVTGVSKASEIRRSPVPIVGIDKEFLQGNLAENVIDAVSKVPGISSINSGPNVSKPVIRGLGFTRVLTLYDGNRQEGQQWGDEHGIEIDQYAIEHAEIIKGPASLSYGSDALAGVINLLPAKPSPEGRLQGEISGEYGGNNGLIGGTAMLKATRKGIDGMARISHKQAADYQNKIDGRVFNTGFNETDASTSAGLHGEWGYAHINFSLYDNKQEVPDGSRDSLSRKFTMQTDEADTLRKAVSDEELKSYGINGLHQRVQHYRVNTNYKFILPAAGDIELFLGYQLSKRREYGHPQALNTASLYLELQTISFDLSYHMPEKKGWNFSTGVNGMYQINEVSKGTEFIIPSYRQLDIGPFMIAKYNFGKLDIEAGLRFDIRHLRQESLYTFTDTASGFERARKNEVPGSTKLFNANTSLFNGISGSLGLSYSFNDNVSLKANLARGYRAPNITELSAEGVHPGTNVYQLGNDKFKPEFSWQPDLGLSVHSKYVVFSADIFYNYIQNYIYNRKLNSTLGGDSIIVPDTRTFQYQSRSAQLYGGEMNLDIHPVKSLHIENSLSLVYGNLLRGRGLAIADSEKFLPFMPPVHGNSEIRYDFKIRKAHIVNAFIKVGLIYSLKQSRVYSAFGTETITPAYALFNAGIGFGISDRKGNSVLNISMLANNLLNTGYQDHLSRLKYFEPYPGNASGRNGIYNMGRNFSLRLTVPLDFAI